MNHRLILRQRLTSLASLLLCVAVYAFPYVLTLAKTGWMLLPPIFDFDQMLYLNLTSLPASHGMVENPWYGNSVPALDVPYLGFPVVFHVFTIFHRVAQSWLSAMLIWNAALISLAFICAVFCSRIFGPNWKPELQLLAALGVLFLRSPLTYFSFVTHVIKGASLFDLTLPYLRFAFPQVIVPVVLGYWGLQTLALRDPSWSKFALLTLLQLLAVSSYPYVVPLIAIGSAIALLIWLLLKPEETKLLNDPMRSFLIFGIVCACLDVAYLVAIGFTHSQGNLSFSLQFKPDMILPSARAYMLLLVCAGFLALKSKTDLPTKCTVGGLAFANAILGFSDVFFPYESMMLAHVNYINDLTTVLPLAVFAISFLRSSMKASVRYAAFAALAVLGLWEGYSSYRVFIKINTFAAEAERALVALDLRSDDLVIAPSTFADDVSSWVPLISRGRVLFTSDAENILSKTSIKSEQTSREAAYLFLTGLETSDLISMTDPNSSGNGLAGIAQHAERLRFRSPLASHQAEGRLLIRQRLLPEFARFEANDNGWTPSFSGTGKVLLIDSSREHCFSLESVGRWFVVKSAVERNGVSLVSLEPRIKQ